MPLRANAGYIGINRTATASSASGKWTALEQYKWKANNSWPSAQIQATGGTITTSGGLRTHVFTSPGTFTISQGGGSITAFALGAGGGGGGADGTIGQPFGQGGGGAGGGGARGIFTLAIGSFSVAVGGGGGAGGDNAPNSPGGSAGSNGGGAGGSSGPSGASGGGGGGGGWTGFSSPVGTYYVVGGGGAGGGGSNEGPANDVEPKGGGSPANTYRPGSTSGDNGNPYTPDGGGYGGCGGGVNGTGGGGGQGGASNNGGSNYTNPIGSGLATYVGGSGGYQATSPNNSGGQGAPGFAPANPSLSPFVPGSAGDGGSGSPSNGVGASAGNAGIVVIQYAYT